MKLFLLSTAAVFTMAFSVSCGHKKETVIESGTAKAGSDGYAYLLTVENMQFHWRADDQELRVKLKAPVKGWLSVGFNPGKKMKDGNFIIGTFEDGKAVVTDQHGIDPKQHKKDTDLGGEDNIRNPSGSQTDNASELRFAFPLKSPDKLDKPIRPDSAVVMLAYGKTNQMAQQHVFWAKARINLLTGAYSLTLLKKGK